MTDISLFLLEKAINNKIHINLNINLTGKALDKYPIRDYIKEGYVPYEILDTAWSGVCHKVFENIGYTDKEYKIADVDQSRLPAVENFFAEIIAHEAISYIMLEIFEEHTWPLEYSAYEINANQLCQIIKEAPNPMHTIPTLSLKIIK